jgi:hypothetical protein
MRFPSKSFAVFCFGLVVLTIVGAIINQINLDPRSQASLEDINWAPLRAANFDKGDFSEWDQTNAADGTLTIINEGSEVPPTSNTSNVKIAKAYQQGSNTTDGHFSRAIWNLNNWTDQIYRSEAWYYLPTGFYSSMEGAVQLMGWDTNPILGNQMRIIIYNGDKKARLFVNENYVGREITDSFAIPEGQWVKLAIEQRISQTEGWSKVYMNDQLMAQGNATSCPTSAKNCQDTYAEAPVTRMRYGLVAIADVQQTKPLTVYFDDVSLKVGPLPSATPLASSNPTSAPGSSPTAAPTSAPITTPVPTLPPTPTPVPTPEVAMPPITETSSLNTGRVGRTYSTKIAGYDLNSNATLSFVATGLPNGFSFGNCTTNYNRKRKSTDIACTISGTSATPVEATITTVLTDNTGLKSVKTFGLSIR